MSEVKDDSDCERVYYMPHHGVHREDSTTTKLGVVFDCSAATYTGKSFNDIQMIGPQIQSDLLTITLRFRMHRYVACADVEKMYRQILVESDQRPLQRIVWGESPSMPLQTYQLNTVTYGTASAPHLAVRCLFQLAQECEKVSPRVAQVIKRDMYVDDLITGSDSIEDLRHICSNISQVLKGGCFHLRKWVANEHLTLHEVEGVSLESTVDFGCDQNKKTLGLIWSNNLDSLRFQVSEISNTRVTKRSVLSNIAQIFDPLGLLSPCIVVAKIFMQKLWLEKLTWDESLPANLHTKWSTFSRDITELNKIQIPRYVLGENAIRIELHCFSDASQDAYGACVYVRSVDASNHIKVRLLCSKTKVSPLRPLTIPKLELCGAVVSAKLANKVITSWEINFDMCIFWSNSTITLAWLKMSPSALKPFVANRVIEISNLTRDGDEFRHVPTKDIPADLLSRGVSPGDLSKLSLWWEGPEWLSEGHVNWPVLEHKGEQSLPELKKPKPVQTCLLSQGEFSLFSKFSNLNKLKRTVAYWLRFKHNCLKRDEKRFGPFSVKELNAAMLRLVKLAQRESFSYELDRLSRGKDLKATSKILSLSPFIDNEQIIRVGGRLDNSKFRFEKKHPMLLACDHQLTKLIFEAEHIRLLHAAPRLLLASVRERYWPVSGMNVAKRTVRTCLRCFRVSPQLTQPKMGSLPEKRVTPAPAFNTTGVDYAGPFHIRSHKGRGSTSLKCYLCLFICFTTKAVHLESVSDLSSEGFLMTLRRFISRRGRPLHIYSDNGKNFVGAQEDLQPLGEFLVGNAKMLTESLANESINWHFIPAYSPHFGGLWEAGVKSSKLHLKRVAGDAKLTYEEFQTLVIEKGRKFGIFLLKMLI